MDAANPFAQLLVAGLRGSNKTHALAQDKRLKRFYYAKGKFDQAECELYAHCECERSLLVFA